VGRYREGTDEDAANSGGYAFCSADQTKTSTRETIKPEIPKTWSEAAVASPDGSIIKGAQGNFPFDRAITASVRRLPREAWAFGRVIRRFLFDTTWLRPDPLAPLDAMSPEQALEAQSIISAGRVSAAWHEHSVACAGTDLIGIRERRYLDRTGLVRIGISATSCDMPRSTKEVLLFAPTTAKRQKGLCNLKKVKRRFSIGRAAPAVTPRRFTPTIS